MLRPISVAMVVTGLVLGPTGTALARGGEERVEEAAAIPVVSFTAELSGVELFGEALVSGRLDPPHPGASVEIAFQRDGKVQERRSAQIADDGTFGTTFDVPRWGTFRAEVTWPGDADHDPATITTEAEKVDAPRPLRQGANGALVLTLERRLDDLDYRLPKPNARFDQKTADAVVAFHKVQGLRRSRTVSMRTWERLTDPVIPKPAMKKPNTHIEIDQSRQVIYVVRRGEIDEIVHTSTGRNGATRNGTFRVHRKIAGYSPNRLYYPSYFDGNRAVHGWPDVPTFPASHGCARVPYWTAKWFYRIMNYGMVVRVYQ